MLDCGRQGVEKGLYRTWLSCVIAPMNSIGVGLLKMTTARQINRLIMILLPSTGEGEYRVAVRGIFDVPTMRGGGNTSARRVGGSQNGA